MTLANVSLRSPDANGLRLPAGFRSRIVARSGTRPSPSPYVWHDAPDGGALFELVDGGWIYVSNSECDYNRGGVGALWFSSTGEIRGAYPICKGSSRNCAGGATPWGTWLTCEEVERGRVWECDPTGWREPVIRGWLGAFSHEAAAVDPVRGHIYLSEDEVDGGLYRYVPDRFDGQRPDLRSGKLQIAEVQGWPEGPVVWHDLPDPDARRIPTRWQIRESSSFNGGEGLSLHDQRLYFATKGDNRLLCYDIQTSTMSIFYDASRYREPVLRGVDGIEVTPSGMILAAQEGADMQMVLIDRNRAEVLLQIEGHWHSEITGIALHPNLERLYFASQRGRSGRDGDGVVFEVSGPFQTLGL